MDVIVYHKPEKAETNNFKDLLKPGQFRGGYFGFLDLKYKGIGEWVKGGVDERLDTWFLKEWPNLFGANDYEDMIFNPRFNINFLGLKVIGFEEDLKRRETRSRAASFANMIAIKYYNIKNVEIPKVPEEYYQQHVLKFYKTSDEKNLLFLKINSVLKHRYRLKLKLSEIAEYLGENYDKDSLKGNK